MKDVVIITLSAVLTLLHASGPESWHHPAICQDHSQIGYKSCLLASDFVKSFSSESECLEAAATLKLWDGCRLSE